MPMKKFERPGERIKRLMREASPGGSDSGTGTAKTLRDLSTAELLDLATRHQTTYRRLQLSVYVSLPVGALSIACVFALVVILHNVHAGFLSEISHAMHVIQLAAIAAIAACGLWVGFHRSAIYQQQNALGLRLQKIADELSCRVE
jgi:hypothetical protein